MSEADQQPAEIVVFGATGYTGELVARRLVDLGARPVLAARNEVRLCALADELGGLEHRVADVERPGSVGKLVSAGDVLISTVGPFARWGGPAVEAALGARAHYIDSAGEAAFMRAMFNVYGPRARQAGVGLIPALACEFAPGNLAAGRALAEAGHRATSVTIGYFTVGRPGPRSVSSGTVASALGVVTGQGFAWRGGQIVDERVARRVVKMYAGGKNRAGVTLSGTEHFTLPRLSPIRDVEVVVGTFGPGSRLVQACSAALSPMTRSTRLRARLDRALERVAARAGSGPSAAERAKIGLMTAAVVRDSDRRELARAEFTGPNHYSLTASLLAWGATTVASGGLQSCGALGPVDGFGLDALEAGCASFGLVRTA